MNLWKKVLIGLIIGVSLGPILAKFPKWLDIASVIGSMFLRSLKMMMGPLIFCTLVKGILNSSNAKSLGRIGFKIVTISVVTTTFAVIFGLGVGILLQPGKNPGFEPALSTASVVLDKFSFKNLIIGIIPENVIEAFSKGNLLQIVFFSIFAGVVMNQFKSKSNNLQKVVSFFSTLVFEMIAIIVSCSPYGVCALMASTIAVQGITVLLSVSKFVAAMIVAMTLQYLIYGLLICIYCRKSPLPFYRKSLEYQLLAFSTSSTKAALPTTIEIAVNKLGISKTSASVMLPISAAVNMNGSAIGLGISAIFSAQLYSIQLDITDYLAIIVSSTLGAIGGAGVPGTSIITLPVVLQSANIPIESVPILASIDRLLDMLRTTVNVTGDVAMTLVVDHSENNWDINKYKS
ncbi:dicarboxylate/amino acid:cation symporter [Candidatus Sneabacter namystus]|uniref:Dicarboxylate/amino acid:cation symporter n=1 Tax=Candidatus Sneabacter namystus TaxID=2601646 RepID=A0A5C0UHY2_9RICK|nr:dicarboxylate/amino acid:cation symporter [Candidatus Sneabacter namystus]QEK39698.1 dicarboxylate/amino acid:cation symporter [Candidatus Sneabacter namystus]